MDASLTPVIIIVAIGVVMLFALGEKNTSPAATKKMYHEYVGFVDIVNDVIREVAETEKEMSARVFASKEEAQECRALISQYGHTYGELTACIDRMGQCIEKRNSRLFKKAMREGASHFEEMKSLCNSLRMYLSRMITVEEYTAQQRYRQEQDEARRNAEKQYEEEMKERLKRKNSHSPNSSVDIFFSGCTTEDAIEKRYKSLAKVYHPDMPTGDEDTFKMMKEEYERVKEKVVH